MSYLEPIDTAHSRPLARAAGRDGASKLLGLELLRFVCALAVLLWHYRHFYRIGGAPEFVQSAQPGYAALALFYDYGLFGVQLFWGISGFIFFWKYGRAIGEGAIGGVRFFWLRFSRLYPLHLATLLIVALLQPIYVALTGASFIYEGNNLPNFLAQLAMATHWFNAVPYSFNGPIWSVSAEIFVYAAFFLLVRCFGAGWGMISAALIISVAAQLTGIVSPALFCAGYFFAGGAAARLFLDAQARNRVSSQRRLSVFAILVIAGSVWLGGKPVDGTTLPFILLLATPPIMLVAAQDWRILERWQSPIQTIGNLTYSTYLSHFPLQLLIAIGCAATGVAPPVQNPLFLVAYLTVTTGVSLWLFERFERPSQNRIRNIALRRAAAAA